MAFTPGVRREEGNTLAELLLLDFRTHDGDISSRWRNRITSLHPQGYNFTVRTCLR